MNAKGFMEAAEKEWARVYSVARKARRLLLTGPPGTGKSYLGVQLAGELSLPYYRMPLNQELSAAEPRGHYIIGGDGAYHFHCGMFFRAWGACGHKPGYLILDEFTHLSPDVEVLLHAVMDDEDIASYTLQTGETVRPHQDFRLVATCNYGIENIGDALASRFDAHFDIHYPNPAILNRIPTELRDVAFSTMETDTTSNPAGFVSARRWLNFLNLMKLGVPQDDALFAAMGANLANVLQVPLLLNSQITSE